MRLVWTRRAVDDLAEIHAFIAADDPATAYDVIDRIRMGQVGSVSTRRWGARDV